jgi:NO-binding membrane sensor protein with MHYT domain
MLKTAVGLSLWCPHWISSWLLQLEPACVISYEASRCVKRILIANPCYFCALSAIRRSLRNKHTSSGTNLGHGLASTLIWRWIQRRNCNETAFLIGLLFLQQTLRCRV